MKGVIHRPLRKPAGRPTPSPFLSNNATSIYALVNDADVAYDAKGKTNLAYGTSTAKPLYGAGIAGSGLTFDGSNDDCFSTVSPTVGWPCFIYGSFVAAAGYAGNPVPICLCNNSASGAFITIRLLIGSVYLEVQRVNVGSVASLAGPTAVGNRVYHVAAVSRSQNEHIMWVNGVRYRSTTDIGASTSNTNLFALGQKRTGSASDRFTGTVFHSGFGSGDPGERFLQQMSVNPWGHLFEESAEYTPGYVAAAATGWGPLLGFGRNSLVVNA